jgi:hypothetical protein
VVQAYGGRRIAVEGGGSVFAFRSPTDAVHCAASVQDAVARMAADADELTRLELQVGVHQGEVHLDRRGAAGAPLATVRGLSEAADVGEVWLTRGVFLTMNRSEAPAEEMGARALAGLGEPVPTYRLARGENPEPYGGRLRAPSRVLRVRPIQTLHTALTSVKVAGATEGRLRAALRVAWSALALSATAALESTAGGLHGAIYRTHRLLARGRRRSRRLDELLSALERARRAAAARSPELALSLRRPVPRRKPLELGGQQAGA